MQDDVPEEIWQSIFTDGGHSETRGLMDFNDLFLEPEQEELLARLVEVHEKLPREQRQDFVYYNLKKVTVRHDDLKGQKTSLNYQRGKEEIPMMLEFNAKGTAQVSVPIAARLHGIPGFQVPSPTEEERVLAWKNAGVLSAELHPDTASGVILHPGLDPLLEVPPGDIDTLKEQGLVRFDGPQEFRLSARAMAYSRQMRARSENSKGESVVPAQTSGQSGQPSVFISHSSKDKPFVRRLSEDLRSQSLDVWVDERELNVGDSITQGISDGLKDTDYLVIVLSRASAESTWVRAELNSALMSQLSNKGVVVLPVLIEDCEIPTLLRDRLYADFRTDYDAGLQSLLQVFRQEVTPVGAGAAQDRGQSAGAKTTHDRCCASLGQLKQAELRRRLTKRMDRPQIAALWFDTLETKMDDDMAGRTKSECVIELLIRAEQQGLTEELLSNICHERENLADP